MGFLRELLAARPVRTQIEFGVQGNIRLTAIDNTPRKRDGQVINKNCFLTFTQYNDKGNPIATSEFDYFNLDADKGYAETNLATQLGHLQNLAKCLGSDKILDPTTIFSTPEEYYAGLKNKKSCKELETLLFDQFAEAVEGLVGDKSVLLRIKTITDKSGNFQQLPKESVIYEVQSDAKTKLSVTPWEIANKAKGGGPQTAKPDAKGDAAPEVGTGKSVLDMI
jgi:hypothetical protein